MSAYSVGGRNGASAVPLLSYFMQCILHGAPGRASGASLAGLWYDSSSVREASGPRKEPTCLQSIFTNLLSARCADDGRFVERRSLCRPILRTHLRFLTVPISSI